ncbi:MAG TPA: hypothetical protein VF334_02195 [Polyangia bacterium]
MSRRLALLLVAAACGCNNGEAPTINTQAMEAYLGMDSSIEKALDLAFVGMNSAATANIAPETIGGDAKGKLVVMGQVDQGTSSSKTIRVDAVYNGYSDDGDTFYATDAAAPPLLALELTQLPYGALSGTFLGVFTMSGLFVGPLTVELKLDGQLQPAGTTGVARVMYSTRIHGTAVSDYGSYAVDFTR